MTGADNWINAKDKPPPLGLPVILTDGKNVAEGYRAADGYKRHYGERWADFGNNFMIVTHWQHMPAPPRRW